MEILLAQVEVDIDRDIRFFWLMNRPPGYRKHLKTESFA